MLTLMPRLLTFTHFLMTIGYTLLSLKNELDPGLARAIWQSVIVRDAGEYASNLAVTPRRCNRIDV